MKKCISLLSFALLSFVSLRAEADAAHVAVTLRAPAACPSRDALVVGAQKRASDVKFSDVRDASAILVDVLVTKKSHGFSGTIAMRSGDANEARTLTADTCAELVDAAGLLIAVFVKAEADTKSEPEPEPEVAAPEPVTVPAPEPPREPDAPQPEPSRRWTPFLGMGLESETGIFPAVAIGPSLFVGTEREASGIFAPSLRLEASLVTSDLAAGSSKEVSLFRGIARLDACPLHFSLGPWIAARPCAWAGAGFFRAEGAAVPKSLSALEPWVDVGARANFHAESSRGWFFELDAGLVVPLTRPTFVLENPSEVVRATPPAGALFAIAAGRRFL